MKQTIRYAILGAMDIEIDAYLRHLTEITEARWNDITFYEGVLFGQNVVVVKSGVGKVFAAMITQRLLDVYHPEAVLFTGVAGALNPRYEIGDVVLSKDCLQHDLDVTAMGFARGAIPFTNYRLFTAKKELLNIASGAKIKHQIHTGRILTGDQFLNTSQLQHTQYLTEELAGDAVEMEGAAVGQVCTINNIPFLIVRTISDKANEHAAVDFENLMPEIANNSFLIMKHILEQAG